MRRDAVTDLLVWKNATERYPLLIRGARQVGKSYLVESFAKEHFKNCVVINFELQPQLKDCFTDLDPQQIITKIQLVMGVEIRPDETLLFLDEIQDCPQAIMALRYFREKMPRMAVIGAGSLLEFTLQQTKFKMPTGRVLFLYLEPLSFAEFLSASGNQSLRDFLAHVALADSIDAVIHQKLLELLRTYLILGGMPAVLKNYFESSDMLACQRLQAGLLQTYRADFGKYAKEAQHKYLQRVFDAAPRLVGQRLKYSAIDSDVKSRDLKSALHLLALAGVVRPVFATSASGLPLGAQTNEQKFKLNFLDVGLMQNACGLQAELAVQKDFMQINAGAIAEQFVGQELRAYANRYTPGDLFFWARDKRGSSAEVDYVISVDSRIIPVEVKAGKTGVLKSLKLFLQEKGGKIGVRVSQQELSFHDHILSVPLYMLEQLSRVVKEMG